MGTIRYNSHPDGEHPKENVRRHRPPIDWTGNLRLSGRRVARRCRAGRASDKDNREDDRREHDSLPHSHSPLCVRLQPFQEAARLAPGGPAGAAAPGSIPEATQARPPRSPGRRSHRGAPAAVSAPPGRILRTTTPRSAGLFRNGIRLTLPPLWRQLDGGHSCGPSFFPLSPAAPLRRACASIPDRAWHSVRRCCTRRTRFPGEAGDPSRSSAGGVRS